MPREPCRYRRRQRGGDGNDHGNDRNSVMSLRLFVCLLPPFLRWFICGCALLLGEATKQISLISTPDGIEVLDLGLDLRDWPTAKFIFKFLQILRVVSS